MPNCKQCQSPFLVDDWDRAFYDSVSPTYADTKFPIPEPKLCPLCRAQRRYVWRGELNLFRRKSDYSGKDIVSFFPPEAKCKVYPNEEWWSDAWNPLAFGRDFDFSRPFFEQFAELIEYVPLLAMSTQQNDENAEYTNCASWNKNCYLLAGANYNEDCYFGNYINRCKNSVDNNFVDSCELCYECVDCTGCYACKYSNNSHNCVDSCFLQNCRTCKNCFCCVNLVNKEYHFMNEPLPKEEYEKRLAALELHKRSKVKEAQKLFSEHRIKYPQKFMIGEMNENVTGNCIHSSKNTFDCFDVSEVWDCRYCHWLHQSKNCMDIMAWGFPAELCYECLEAGQNAYRAMFSVSSYGGHELLYTYYAMYCKHCFGCVGMKRNEYCILNKQYSPADYEQMVAKIIAHMQETGEWGEFFPVKLSPLPYNTTIAQDYFPLGKEDVETLGWSWHDFTSDLKTPEVPFAVPDSIHDVDEDILKQVLTCAVSKKPYKIIKQEYAFYKENSIPIPDFSFMARHQVRLTRRTPRQLWDRACAKCSKELRTSFPPWEKDIVYCEECYLGEVY